MKHANFATYRDMSNEVYTEADMARMATRIWNGQRRSGINRQGRTKWCDATAVGINMRKAWFVDTIANWPNENRQSLRGVSHRPVRADLLERHRLRYP